MRATIFFFFFFFFFFLNSLFTWLISESYTGFHISPRGYIQSGRGKSHIKLIIFIQYSSIT